MKNKIVKVASVTPKIKLGDIEYNKNHIIELIEKLQAESVDVSVFSRFPLTGYSIMDMASNASIINKTNKYIDEIILATKHHNMLVAISVIYNNSGKNHDLLLLISDGKILGVKANNNLDKFGEVDETRNLSRMEDEFYYKGVMVKKDLNINIGGIYLGFSETPLRKNSISLLMEESKNVDIFFNSCSKEKTLKTKDFQYIQNISDINEIGYVYAGSCIGESSTDIVYSTEKCIIEVGSISQINEEDEFVIGYINTNLLNKKEKSRNSCIYYPIEEVDNINDYKINKFPFYNDDSDCKKALDIQVKALAQRLEAIGCKKVILGLSGGADSTLALIVCIETMKKLNLPLENIITISMPCFGTSNKTKNNSHLLQEYFNVTKRTIDISESVKNHLKMIGHDLITFDAAYENAQARERTHVLLNLANMHSAIVVGTGDLSEIALGFATYSGDHIAHYSVNAGIPKTFVKEIIRYYGKTQTDEINNVLISILKTPISPELLPTNEDGDVKQKTEEIVGPYELHDFFIYYFIKHKLDFNEILQLTCHAFRNEYSEVEVKKWLKVFVDRFFKNQFKRSCSPDGPLVTEISLSPELHLECLVI